jgi:hypothetical protein
MLFDSIKIGQLTCPNRYLDGAAHARPRHPRPCSDRPDGHLLCAARVGRIDHHGGYRNHPRGHWLLFDRNAYRRENYCSVVQKVDRVVYEALVSVGVPARRADQSQSFDDTNVQ